MLQLFKEVFFVKNVSKSLLFFFATGIVQLFPNPKFPASSHLLYLYSSVYVGDRPVLKPHCWFSHAVAQIKVSTFCSTYLLYCSCSCNKGVPRECSGLAVQHCTLV